MDNQKANLTSHFLLWIGLVSSIPGTFWITKPALEKFVERKVIHETNEHRYEVVTEMLTIFRNTPEEEITPYHRAEIARLEATQAKLLQELGKN